MNIKRVLLNCCLGACCLWASLQAVAAELKVGVPAPEIQARLLDGGTRFSLSESRGKVVILNFWATWCTPCLAEMPALEAYYTRHKSEGLEILAISMDDPRNIAAVRAMASRFSFPVALKSEADFKGLGRIWRMPSTFVVDREGILRKNGSTGEAEVNLPLLESLVTPLLRQPRTTLQRAAADGDHLYLGEPG
jgi:peroxiredoxin